MGRHSVRIVFPTFEDGGTHVNVSGIAMTQAAPNREEALQLMEFLVSPTAQAIYAEENYEYPVLESAETSDLVAGLGRLRGRRHGPRRDRGNRAAALRIMEEVNFDG